MKATLKKPPVVVGELQLPQDEREVKAAIFQTLAERRRLFNFTRADVDVLRVFVSGASCSNRPEQAPEIRDQFPSDVALTWPGTVRLMRESSCSDRTIRSAITKFKQLEILQPVSEIRGGPTKRPDAINAEQLRTSIYVIALKELLNPAKISGLLTDRKPLKPGNSCQETRKNTAPNPEKHRHAYKEDNKRDNERGSQHQQQQHTADVPRAVQESVAAADAPIPFPTTPDCTLDDWDSILAMLDRFVFDSPLGGTAAAIIRSRSEEFNFTPRQFLFAVEHSSFSLWGGAIRLAEHWPRETSRIPWPGCVKCHDTGFPLIPLRKKPQRRDKEQEARERSRDLGLYTGTAADKRLLALYSAARAISTPERIRISQELGLGFCSCAAGSPPQATGEPLKDQTEEYESRTEPASPLPETLPPAPTHCPTLDAHKLNSEAASGAMVEIKYYALSKRAPNSPNADSIWTQALSHLTEPMDFARFAVLVALRITHDSAPEWRDLAHQWLQGLLGPNEFFQKGSPDTFTATGWATHSVFATSDPEIANRAEYFAHVALYRAVEHDETLAKEIDSLANSAASDLQLQRGAA